MNARCSLGGNAAISETDASRTSTTSTRRSAIRDGGENSDYHVDRKTGWRYCREPRGNPSAASSSSTSQWQNSQWQTSWGSWYSTSSDKKVVISVSWKEFQRIDGRVQTGHPLTKHICAVQFVQCTNNALGSRASTAQELQCHLCALENKSSHLVRCMSHPWLFSHALSSMNTSCSSPTYHTTQREHPAHHAHFQAPSVDKLRRPESLWREDLQRRKPAHNNSHI